MKKLLFLFFFCSLTFSMYAQVQRDSIMHEGTWRTYRIYTPSGYNGSQAYPLVINMHGYGSNSYDQMIYSGMNNVADTSEFLVVYPQGINDAWNAGFLTPYHSGVDDVGFLSKLLDTLEQDYNINTCKVYSTGMSNGGYMSHRLACELESRITAIAGVTGTVTDSTTFYCQSQRPVPMLQIQGTADGVVNYNGGAGYLGAVSTLSWWAQKNGCMQGPDTTQFPDVNTSDNSTITAIRYSNCTDSAEAILYRVNNGGHTWPGAFPVASLGNTNQDIEASVEIWEFFKKYDCSNTTVEVEELPRKVKELQIYPVPAGNDIRLSGPEGKYALKIIDGNGRLVMNKSYFSAKEKVNISHLPQGIYFAVIYSPVTKKLHSKKFIKK